jgi:hypothetical protein
MDFNKIGIKFVPLEITLLVAVSTAIIFAYSILKFERGEVPAIGLWCKSCDIYNDKSFIPILNNISKTIPIGESIASNFGWGAPAYFINHDLEIPSTAAVCTNNSCSSYSSTEKSLIEWMTRMKLTYLLIFENITTGSEELIPSIFDANGLQYLKDREDEILNHVRKDNMTINYLSEMAHYTTDNNITIYLYKLKALG